EGKGRDIGTDEKKVGAELLHDVELALGTIEGALTVRWRHAFKVSEGLEEADVEPVVADHPADIGRTTIECEEVVLEDLHGVEAGRGDRRELLGQFAADRDGRNRGLHRSLR